MRLVKQSHEIMYVSHWEEKIYPLADGNEIAIQRPEQLIEKAGRTCYKSEDAITPDSANKFVKMVTKRGHHSVLEHSMMTVKFITNRGVTHELVRHRLAAYSQESTRYVNYGGDDIQFIVPVWAEEEDLYRALAYYEEEDAGAEAVDFAIPEDVPEVWFISACLESESHYKNLLKSGWRPEQAREVLPNALKTEIVMTANFREWLHVFNLRCSKAAHPQMRSLMSPLQIWCQVHMPSIFNVL